MPIVSIGTYTLNWKTKEPVQSASVTVNENRVRSLIIREVGGPVVPTGQFVTLVPRLDTSEGPNELTPAAKFYPKNLDLFFFVGIPSNGRFTGSQLSILLYPCGYRPNAEQPTERSFELLFDDNRTYNLGQHP